jgi:hypothetical protein
MNKVLNLWDFSEDVLAPEIKIGKDFFDEYFKVQKTPQDIAKLFIDCFFNNVEPKDFLLKLPKIDDEVMHEIFNLYHRYWHVRTCGPSRYKNCEMPLINVNAKMMHRGNYKEINKMIFYKINNPTVVKKKKDGKIGENF